MSDWRATPVEASGLPTRAKNSLIRSGFYSLGDVALASDVELLRCAELGRGTLREVRDYIENEFKFIGGSYRIQLERQLGALKERRAIMDRDISELEHRLAQ
jgi:DNA-directed RNA polymerase alpha subunit